MGVLEVEVEVAVLLSLSLSSRGAPDDRLEMLSLKEDELVMLSLRGSCETG